MKKEIKKAKPRASDKIMKCDLCGKTYAARGIKSHMRLFHHLKVTEVEKVVVEKKYEQVKKLSANSTKIAEGSSIIKVLPEGDMMWGVFKFKNTLDPLSTFRTEDEARDELRKLEGELIREHERTMHITLGVPMLDNWYFIKQVFSPKQLK